MGSEISTREVEAGTRRSSSFSTACVVTTAVSAQPCKRKVNPMQIQCKYPGGESLNQHGHNRSNPQIAPTALIAIHPHIIHRHLRGKHRARIRRTGPAPHSNIQDECLQRETGPLRLYQQFLKILGPLRPPAPGLQSIWDLQALPISISPRLKDEIS